MNIKFDSEGFAESSGWVEAYQCDLVTGELLGQGQSYVTQGSGLPAGAYLESPPEKQPNKIVIRPSRESGWLLVDDFRGQNAYEISSKATIQITWIGPLPPELTLLEPGEYDKWVGDRWEFDPQLQAELQLIAAKDEISQRLDEANTQIAILKPAVDGGYAKPGHAQLLSDWQRYSYELALVPEQPGWPESPQLPEKPALIV